MNSDFRDLLFEFNAAEVRYLVLPPNRIDVLTEIAGVTFGDAWARRASGQYGDQSMWVLGKQDLITNKRAVGRPRDLEDVRELEST